METIKHRILCCFLFHLSSKGLLLPVTCCCFCFSDQPKLGGIHYRPNHPFLDLLDLFLAKELVEVGLGAQ